MRRNGLQRCASSFLVSVKIKTRIFLKCMLTLFKRGVLYLHEDQRRKDHDNDIQEPRIQSDIHPARNADVGWNGNDRPNGYRRRAWRNDAAARVYERRTAGDKRNWQNRIGVSQMTKKEELPENCTGEDCECCSDEYCMTHFAEPCDCDVIDRHTINNGKSVSQLGIPWMTSARRDCNE